MKVQIWDPGLLEGMEHKRQGVTLATIIHEYTKALKRRQELGAAPEAPRVDSAEQSVDSAEQSVGDTQAALDAARKAVRELEGALSELDRKSA